MENSISYYKPINRYFRRVNLDEWFISFDEYEAGNSYSALVHLLRYINSPAPIPDGDSLELKIPHGSVNIHIKANKESLSIDVPFLKFTPESSKLPAMRQMIEQNFSSLILGQIVLKEGALWFHYEDRIENFEPYKIYYLLDEICAEADNNDDYYIDRFKLEHVEKPEYQPFTGEELQKASEIMKNIITQGIKYAEYFENKRYYNTACDMLAITFFRIKYTIFPQGIFGREVQDGLLAMYSNESVQNVISSTKAKLNSFLDYNAKKFEESLFHPNFLMPIKPRAEIPKIQEFLAPVYEKAKQGIINRVYADTAIILFYNFYNLMDLYTIPADFSSAFDKVFERCADKDWKFTSEQLFKILGKIFEIRLDENGNVVEGSMDLGETESSGGAIQSVKNIFSKITNVFKK